MSLDAKEIIVVTGLVANVIIVFGYFSWCCVLLHRHSREQYFVKRRPFLIVIIYLCGVGFWAQTLIAGWRTLRNIEQINSFDTDTNEDSTTFFILLMGEILNVLFGSSFGFTLSLIRIWLLYYDMQVSHILKNKNWQMIIDSNSIENNWYFKSKNQKRYYNNGKMLFKIGFTFDVIYFCLCWILNRYRYDWFSQFLVLFDLLVKVTIGGLIWRKFGQFSNRDSFSIHKELKAFIIYGLITFFPFSFGYYAIQRYSGQFYFSLYILIVYPIMLLIPFYIWVPFVIRMQRKKMSKINSISFKEKGKEKEKGNGNCKKRMHWSAVVSDSEGYQEFINHLESEFSVENLLFITEYIQIKNFLKQRYNTIWQQLINDKNHASRIKFNVLLPTSNKDIVYSGSVSPTNITSHNKKKSKLNALILGSNIAGINSSDNETETQVENNMDINNMNNTGDDNGIPVSKIVQQMMQVFAANDSSQMKTQNDNYDKVNINYNEDGLNIIRAFQSLYNKYVNGNGAPFMINIASNTRDQLMISLDNGYYRRSKGLRKNSIQSLFSIVHLSDNNNDSNNNEIRMNEIATDDDDDEKTHTMIKENEKCFLIEQFSKEHKCEMKWLLFELTCQMDQAAIEISKLMNDSFLRFDYSQR